MHFEEKLVDIGEKLWYWAYRSFIVASINFDFSWNNFIQCSLCFRSSARKKIKASQTGRQKKSTFFFFNAASKLKKKTLELAIAQKNPADNQDEVTVWLLSVFISLWHVFVNGVNKDFLNVVYSSHDLMFVDFCFI